MKCLSILKSGVKRCYRFFEFSYRENFFLRLLRRRCLKRSVTNNHLEKNHAYGPPVTWLCIASTSFRTSLSNMILDRTNIFMIWPVKLLERYSSEFQPMKRLPFFFDDFCDLIFSNLSWLMLGDSIDEILYKNWNRESIWIQYKVQNRSIWYVRHGKSGHYLVWYHDGWNPFRGRMIRHKPILQCRIEPNFPWNIFSF